MKYHRTPKTTQERREAQENTELIRPKRNHKNLPNAWDDIGPGRGHSHSEMRYFRRWLAKQVGRPMADVFSDGVNKFEHARQYFKWDIDDVVEFINGVPYGKYGKLTSHTGYPTYYEHPETRKLCVAPLYKHNKKPRPCKRVKTDDPMVEYRKLDGIWYECLLKDSTDWWWRGRKVIVSKRQLGKTRLKKLGLSNN